MATEKSLAELPRDNNMWYNLLNKDFPIVINETYRL
jgi:hypothetical protein